MSDAPSSLPDRRPAVARVISDRGVWIFAVAAAVGGGVLFSVMENRRTTLTAPALAPGPESAGGSIQAPPELSLPPSWQVPPQATQPALPPMASPSFAPQPVAAAAPIAQPQRYARETPQYAPMPQVPALGPVTPQVAEVFRAQPSGPAGASPKQDTGKAERVEASRFANPATTVPKGTVMQAVLESALDSSRAGLARAIISRDIYGFDGTRILIPRGSRLIGEYKADVQQGQSRALIEWQRLMRPDGVIINLDSPSADPLGRAGVKGKVNGHFLARYGSAILQSALQIGEQAAVNSIAPAATIYAAPSLYGLQGTAQGTGQAAGLTGSNVQPTVTVKQGTSVSVFVARDLDFTSVEP
jgi:type IV secretion system protein VirB10